MPVYEAALASKESQQIPKRECSHVYFEVWNHVLPLLESRRCGNDRRGCMPSMRGKEGSVQNAQVHILLIRNADILAFQHMRSQC